MADQLDLNLLTSQTRSKSERPIALLGKRGQAFRVASATALVGTPPKQTDTIQIAIDLSEENGLLARFRIWFWGILIGALAVCPLPVTRLPAAAFALWLKWPPPRAASLLITFANVFCRKGYPSELASLAATFNKMLDRLEESFERISRFSGDIAHDLRTPVNNIRGEAEVALARARTIDEYRDVLESWLGRGSATI